MRNVLGCVLLVAMGACAVEPDESTVESESRRQERRELVAATRANIATRGLTAIPDAPYVRPALVRLGRALAFDKILSGNKDVSCMTCHPPGFATGDGRHVSMGVTGRGIGPDRTGNFAAGEEGRNAPPIFNLHAMNTFFWDGRVENLPGGHIRTPAGNVLTAQQESVAEFGAISLLGMFPVTARDEMRGFGNENELSRVTDGDFQEIWKRLMNRLRAIPKYKKLFEDAYPGTRFENMTFAHASNAIGGFIVARFEANDSPWDKFLRGNDNAMSFEALKGAEIFTRTCVNCHGGSTGSDQQFHNTLLAQFGPGPRSGGDGASHRDDFGRERVTGAGADRYRFRTTPLRNVEFTGPYGHTGEIVDLRDFVDHYSVHVDEDGNTIGDIPGPVQNLLEWDETQVDRATRRRGPVVDNFEDVIAARDPLFFAGSPIRPEFVDPITEFMFAQTDERSINSLRRVTPRTVPSGLPVSYDGHGYGDPDDDY